MAVAVAPGSTGPDPAASTAPAPEAGTTGPGRLLGLFALVAWLPVSVVLQLTRSSRTPVWDSVWAEDGRYFYGNARTHPWQSTLFEQLGGYLQVVPRGYSIVAAQFPVEYAALLIALMSAATASVLSVYVFVTTRGLLPQLWQRYAVAALVAVHPAAGWEVNAAVNNVHWFLMIAAFWACLSKAGNRWRTAADVVVVVLSALSDALTALWLPIVLFRALRGRGSARPVAVAMVVALAMQYALAVQDASPNHGEPQYRAFPEVFAFRLAGSLLVGETWNRALFVDHGAVWALIAAVLAVGLLTLGLLRTRGRQRVLVALAVSFGIAFFAAPLVLRGGAEAFLLKPVRSPGSRYVIIPLYLLYVALIVSAGALATCSSRSASTDVPGRAAGAGRPTGAGRLVGAGRFVPPVLVGGLLVVHLVSNFAPLGARTGSTSWKQAVASAEVACANGQVGKRVPSDLPRIAQPYLRSPGVVWIPVAPWSDNWPARLPCDHLTQ